MTVPLKCDTCDCWVEIRQNLDRPSDFSVILMYKSSRGTMHIIVRYNGNHGRHRNPLKKDHISGPHIHTICEGCQRAGLREDSEAEGTDRYRGLAEAVEVFKADLHICYKDSESSPRNTKITDRCDNGS